MAEARWQGRYGDRLQLWTMSVRELKDLIEHEDDDTLIVATCNYGDYSRTEQVIPLDGELEEVHLEGSAYSQSGLAVPKKERYADDEEDEEDLTLEDEAKPKVLAFRYLAGMI